MTSKTVKNIGFANSFPALRGTQAGREFYAAMCPMGLVPKIFVFNEEEVPPELRAQRTLNRNRVPVVAQYMIQNPENYIVSALTASVDCSVKFEPLDNSESVQSIGILSIPMDAKLLINDGQHRRAAIEQAVKENPELRNDYVPILFFIDKGLKRSQQMFVDLNKNVTKPSDSLNTLYDHRDPISATARYAALSVDVFKGMTEMEKSSLSNRSTKLFTLSGIKHASRALLCKKRNESVTPEEEQLVVDYWKEVAKHIPDWGNAKRKIIAPNELRRNCIHAHGVTLAALGMAGADLLSKYPQDWNKRLEPLQNIDWSRSNHQLWEGRAMVLGKISKARNNVILTSTLIKCRLGLELSVQEMKLESELAKHD